VRKAPARARTEEKTAEGGATTTEAYESKPKAAPARAPRARKPAGQAAAKPGASTDAGAEAAKPKATTPVKRVRKAKEGDSGAGEKK
jgi:hypothetical protein